MTLPLEKFTLTDAIISTPTRGTPVKLPRRTTTHAFFRPADLGRKDYDWLLKILSHVSGPTTARVFISDAPDGEGVCILDVGLSARPEISRLLPGRLFSLLAPSDDLYAWLEVSCDGRAEIKATIERAR